MKKKIILFFAALSTAIYIIWRIGWSLPYGFRPVDMIFAIILLCAEMIGFIEASYFIIGENGKAKYDSDDVPVIPEADYPDVDVFISTYNESTELLKKTVEGCKNMDYPDKGKVHIFICDDNARDDMAMLARKMHVGYFRRDNHNGAKAGNLNHAMSLTSSPLVATFDADMIPVHDFLMAIVPYFYCNMYEKNKDNIFVRKDVSGKL